MKRTALTAMATALLTALAMGGVSADAAGNPPVVNPLDIDPYWVAKQSRPCSPGGSSVPLVGELGQFYECSSLGKWSFVTQFADPDGVRQPLGSVQLLESSLSAPDGYLEANGQAFDPAVFADLATLLAPSTNVPNLGAQAPAGQKIYLKALP